MSGSMRINKGLKTAGIVLVLNLIGHSVLEMTRAFDQINSGDPWTEEIDKEITAYEKMQLGESYYMVGTGQAVLASLSVCSADIDVNDADDDREVYYVVAVGEEFETTPLKMAAIESKSPEQFNIHCRYSDRDDYVVSESKADFDQRLPSYLQADSVALFDGATAYILTKGDERSQAPSPKRYLKISNGHIVAIRSHDVTGIAERSMNADLKMSELQRDMKAFALSINQLCLETNQT